MQKSVIYYFYIMSMMLSITNFLFSMENDFTEDIDKYHYRLSADHAYRNGQLDLALGWYKEGMQDQSWLDLFKKIESIEDEQKRKEVSQCYCHCLYITRICDQLKIEFAENEEYIQFLRESVWQKFDKILQEKQEIPIARAIVTKVLQRLQQDDCKWLLDHAYNYDRQDLAMKYFRQSADTISLDLFKKIDAIPNEKERKKVLQCYGYFLFASEQCAQLKVVPKDDVQRINSLKEKIIPKFRMILEEMPEGAVEKEIVDKTLDLMSTDYLDFLGNESCIWLAGYAYNYDRPDRALTCFNQSIKNKEPSELLSQINSMEDHQKRVNARHGYYHYQCGITMIEHVQSEEEITHRCQQAITQAFRHTLAIKLDSLQARQVMVEAVARLKILKESRNLYATWELMRYYFNVKKFDKAFDELSSAILWKDYSGFHYSQEQQNYLFCKDTLVDEINGLDLAQIMPQGYRRGVALHETSQLALLCLIYKNDINSNALKIPLQRAEEAVGVFSGMFTTNPESLLDTSRYLTSKWWYSMLKLEKDYLVLQKFLEGKNKKQKVSKIIQYLQRHNDMNIQCVRNFINTILEGNKEITERDFLKEKNNTIKRIFAFKKFINEGGSVEDKKEALDSLSSLAETDIYAANMLGIMCTYPKYSFLEDSDEAAVYKLKGIAALLKVYTEVSTQKPEVKMNISLDGGRPRPIYNYNVVLERYYPLLGNPYIHADLADIYVNNGSFGKMYEHIEDMFNTCYLAERTPEFLGRKINSILGTLSTCIHSERDGNKKIAEDFINDMRQKLLEREVQIENLENYGKLMARITTTNNNQSNT